MGDLLETSATERRLLNVGFQTWHDIWKSRINLITWTKPIILPNRLKGTGEFALLAQENPTYTAILDRSTFQDAKAGNQNSR